MPTDSFTLPLKDKDRTWPSDSICVVGLIGKDGVGPGDKASLLNLALERQLFPAQRFRDRRPLGEFSRLSSSGQAESGDGGDGEENEEISLKGYYDAEQQTLYIALISMYDITQLAKICERSPKNSSHLSWSEDWKQREQKCCNALLLMFSICHLILVSHPTEQFDPAYLHLFEALSARREAVENDLTSYLEETLGDDVAHLWLQSGRCALPRLLLVMRQTSPYLWLSDSRRYSGSDSFRSDSSETVRRDSDNWIQRQTTRYGAAPPAKRFQLFVEDQIFNILKKSRSRLMSGANALFTLSQRKFMHVITSEVPSDGSDPMPSFDSVSILMRSLPASASNKQLLRKSRPVAGGGSTQSESPPDSENMEYVPDPLSQMAIRPVAVPGRYAERGAEDSGQRLQGFLQRHVEAVHQSSDSMVFDAVAVGENSAQLPACNDWFAVASALYDFLLGPDSKALADVQTGAKTPFELQSKFSENRCKKAVPNALKVYKDGLSSLYTSNQHAVQLANALRTFSQQARGPSSQEYEYQIRQQCEEFWKNGHQACEEVSLTGHACQLPYHVVSTSTDVEASLSSTKPQQAAHSNYSGATHACNCGRSQGSRADPFTLKDANFSFFDGLEENCCSQLTRFVFHCQPMLYASGAGEFSLPILYCEMPPDTGSSRQHLQARQSQVTMLASDDSGHNLSAKEPTASESRLSPSDATSKGGAAEEKVSRSVMSHRHHNFVEQTAIDLFSMDETTDSEAKVGMTEEAQSLTAAMAAVPPSSAVDELTAGIAAAGLDSHADDVDDDDEGSPELPSYTATGQWPLYASELAGSAGQSGACQLNDGVQEYEQEDEDEEVSTLRPNNTSLSLNESMEVADGLFMLHSRSADGLLPAYPTWSVVNLGSASLYASGSGLVQPGFLTGSNFLLAWDIPVSSITQNGPVHLAGVGTWTSLSETAQRNRVVRAPRSSKAPVEVNNNVRVFVGMEYECCHGNRFLAASPNKPSKIHPTGHLKDSASRVLSTPMPLYMACSCRSAGKAHLAQLMRFFITTPPAGIQLVLHPNVQPCPAAPVFHPSWIGGITLPAGSFCVLRFPYVYADENGAFLPPADHAPNQYNGCLHEGLIELR